MQYANRFPRGFSLAELLAVMAIMAILAGLTVPAVTHLGSSERLSGSARTVSNLLTVARSEAIAKQTKLRFGVVTDWAENSRRNFRMCGVWKHDPATNQWVLAAKLEEIAEGVSFTPEFGARTGTSDAGNVFGENPANTFSTILNGKTAEVKFVELLPTGAVNAPGMAEMNVWMALAETAKAESEASLLNWAKIDASVLTGRLKILRP